MLALSETFAKVFLLELSRWTEGMPTPVYRDMLRRHRLPPLPPVTGTPQIMRTVKRDIDDPGRMGLVTVDHIGLITSMRIPGCIGCETCVSECPGRALSIMKDAEPPMLFLAHELCDGVACRRCERVCPVNVFRLDAFFGATKCREAVQADDALEA